ncbi:hypothetical protein THAOC_33361, partial [Thalassiosira oceanica]
MFEISCGPISAEPARAEAASDMLRALMPECTAEYRLFLSAWMGPDEPSTPRAGGRSLNRRCPPARWQHTRTADRIGPRSWPRPDAEHNSNSRSVLAVGERTVSLAGSPTWGGEASG